MRHQPERLHTALSAMGDELSAVGEHAHLIVMGGSGLIAIEAVSRVTRDVDVIAIEQDGELVSAEPLPKVDDAMARALADLGVEDEGRSA